MQLRRRFSRIIVWLTLIVLILSVAKMFADENKEHSFTPKEGFVPNEATATRIAEAVLIPIYGKDRIESQRPLTATLRKGVWIVRGSIPKGFNGGVATIELSKKDARVVRVSHGK